MKLKLIASAAALGLALVGCSTVDHAVTGTTDAVKSVTAPKGAAQTAPKLHAAMRDLWLGHIHATRDYALAVHAGDAAAAKTAQRAEIANGHAIADAVADVYGKDAGNGIFRLVGGHVQGVNDLTWATKKRDSAAEDKAMGDLTTNAMDISKFLAGANPNWTVNDLNQALLMHAGDHKKQIDQIMANAPAAEQEATWKHMQGHMDMIADALSDGIAKQFPDKVS